MWCKTCEEGDAPQVLDVDGVRSELSGKQGIWAHAWGGSWWPCQRKAAEEHAIVDELRKGNERLEKEAIERDVSHERILTEHEEELGRRQRQMAKLRKELAKAKRALPMERAYLDVLDRHRDTPDGFLSVAAYTDGREVVVLGDPPNEGNRGDLENATTGETAIRVMCERKAEIERLKAVVAELRHQADCYWYDLGAGQWARDNCEECRTLWEAVEATRGPKETGS